MELTEGFKANLIETAKALRGHQRRLFIARTVQSLGTADNAAPRRSLAGAALRFVRGCTNCVQGSPAATPFRLVGGRVRKKNCRGCWTTSETSPRVSVKRTLSFGIGVCIHG